MAHYQLEFSHSTARQIPIYRLMRDGEVIQQETTYGAAFHFIITVGEDTDTWSDNPQATPRPVSEDRAKEQAKAAFNAERDLLVYRLYQWSKKGIEE